MKQTNWPSVVAEALDDRTQHHTLRHRRAVQIVDSTHLEIDGRRFVNFSSNNYLGLTHHPKVLAAFENAARTYGVGSGAAALVTGQSDAHASAERTLASWKKTESAVLLSSGYAANLAVVQMLAVVGAAGEKRGVRFLLDKLSHASLVDAVRAVTTAKVTFRVFPHNHMAKLRRLLEEADPKVLQVVITESIFSMDGDAADLPGIAALKREFPFLLVLDEAHGTGVYGPAGSGYAAELGLSEIVDISIITLSKAMGCSGGAVCASTALCEAIVNFGRSYIFSTAIPPAIAAAVEAAIGVMRDGSHRQQRVRELAKRVRSRVPGDGFITNKGLITPVLRYSEEPGLCGVPPRSSEYVRTSVGVMKLPLNLPGDSPIVPIILGEESRALAATDQLRQQGILVIAVRPPTVPRGTSRLRVTLSCDHSDDEVEKLIAELQNDKGASAVHHL